MSQKHNSVGLAVARATTDVTSAAILHYSSDGLGGMHLAMSAIAGPLMLLGGLMSKSFQDSDGSQNPGLSANVDNILLGALLVARCMTPRETGVGVELSADLIADALADFRKLCPLADVDKIVRSDLVALVNDQAATADALTSGILAKRPPTSSIN